MNKPAQTTSENPWKETVRDIFDRLILARGPSTPLETAILKMIETRHHDFFCTGHTMKEWEAIKNAEQS